MTRYGLVTAAALIIAMTGCQAPRSPVHKFASSPTATDMLGPDPGIRITSPADYRRAREQAALRGLRYDNGRVTVDEAFAAGLAERGDRAAAVTAYEQGERYLIGNRRTDALGAFTRAIIRWTEEADFYDGLGRALIFKGKHDKAIAAYRTGLELAPASVELRYHLADALVRTGELEAALDAFRRVLEVEPNHGPARRRIATLHYYAGNESAAWGHIRAAEAVGEPVPSQLRRLLDGTMPAPVLASLDGVEVGPQIRIDTNGGTFASNETTISAAEPAPTRVVAAWNDWRESGVSEVIRMGVGYSADGGQTWTDFVIRPPADYQSNVEGDPMTCYDNRTGNLWVGAISFSPNGGVYVARRQAGGLSFLPSVMTWPSSSADKCWMAAGVDPDDPNQTRVYVAFNEGCQVSSDLGATWSDPVDLGQGLGQLPRVGPQGQVYVAYWDFWDQMMIRRSFDGGESFGSEIAIAQRMDTWSIDGTRFPGTFRVPPLNYLAVDPNDGTLYCVYADTTNIVDGNYNVDLYFAKSTDEGANWTSPVVINQDSDPPGDQFWPWIEVDAAGVLHMIFYNTRHTEQDDQTMHGMIDAYYARSDDGGATWGEFRLTPESFDSADDGLDRTTQFLGDYLGLAVAGDHAYPCYVSTQNGDTDVFTNVITYNPTPPLCRGDMNCNGVVDFGDIDPFVAALGCTDGDPNCWPPAGIPDACPWLNADCNEDEEVTFADIDPFVALIGTSCP